MPRRFLMRSMIPSPPGLPPSGGLLPNQPLPWIAPTAVLCKSPVPPTGSARWSQRDGRCLLTYHKVHTCSFSLEALMEPGDRFATANFDGVKMGVMICFDREFPESARELMLQGAELILVPNACPMDPARLAQLSTRAFENMTIMAMAN